MNWVIFHAYLWNHSHVSVCQSEPDPDRLTWFSLDRAGLTHRALHLSDVGDTLHQLHHTPLSLHVTNSVSRRDVAPGQNYIVRSQNTDRRHRSLRLVVLLHSEIPVNVTNFYEHYKDAFYFPSSHNKSLPYIQNSNDKCIKQT